jgi:hypothetical protein
VKIDRTKIETKILNFIESLPVSEWLNIISEN